MMFLPFTASFLLLFLLQHFSIHLKAYNPEIFTINCGTTAKSSDGQRMWTGDADTKYLSPQDTISEKATTQSPSANQIPFSTARLSSSQFNYTFPVSPGPKFVRLFFYPADYSSFLRTHASFSVQSNQFTLLDAFNASLNADAQATDTIFREYVVNVKDGESLILTFTPSHPNSYAFINGIEVLSMPTDLYYTPPDDPGFTLVGHDTLFSIGSSTPMETVYRIKSGGQEISPQNDTGLFRYWAPEESYFIKHNPKNNDLPADIDGKMNITVNPDYLAPKELFRTARNMGTNATLNRMSNLTWEFPVDCGFIYVVRLHFCELDPNINNIGDRRFSIYIASQLADGRADVMKWSQKRKGLAVHRNYVVLIPNNGTQKKYNLSLQMHPYESSVDTRYSDAFLNGLEIFKTNVNNLAGPEPDPLQTPHNIILGKTSSGSGKTTIVVVTGVGIGVVFISLVILFVVVSRHMRTTETNTWVYKSKSFTATQKASLPSDLCRHFSLGEIEAATNNFDDVFIVGVGGFGHVYKGYIDGGFTPVAIKRLKPGSQQGAHEFLNEIEMLSQLRHLHLVSLIGYCNEMNEMILVYDFMARGTLRDHLYNTDNPAILWKQRLKICIGAARGLHYLHTGGKHTIIHRDVKTTNILLDDKWVAKVSDFGLSRIGPTGTEKSHVSTHVKGSFGYIDPEYYKRFRLTEKSDVYSFGVVLFEVLCGRPALIHSAETQQVSLSNWVRHSDQNGTLAEIVDPTLKNKIAPECLKMFCQIGISCLLEDGTKRPCMKDVVAMLEFTLQLQESAEQHATEKGEEISEDGFSTTDLYVTTTTSTSEDNSYSNNTVSSWTPFSEIMDPKPR
ncbi:receptor-like protein kinase FERONIA [Vigna radiata var. radiata]|uniref:Receptor-like protein kinase FERONIA n=1 Tax=Vigna radiata var. radiata TaxID=3916 RepID=A0A1S3VGB3_VIGRR|nr:receptor-like protein kinase FERONIA [Vigna radiata var. radiata]